MKNIILYLPLLLLAFGCQKDSGGEKSRFGKVFFKEIFYDEVTAQADLPDRTGIVEKGFYYSDACSVDPASAEQVPALFDDGVRFESYISGLESGKSCFVKPYARDKDGNCFFGQEIAVRTSTDRIEYVSLTDASWANTTTAKSAQVFGKVSDSGGDKIREYGAYYWKKDPDIESGTVKDLFFLLNDGRIKKESVFIPEDDQTPLVDTDLAVNISGLEPETEYQFQFYARNARREQFKQIDEIKTLAVEKPEIELREVDDVSSTTALVGCRITSIGNDPQAEYGVYYGTQLPLTDKVAAEDPWTEKEGGYDFEVLVRGLLPSTGYYFQGYVKNDHSETRTEVSSLQTTQPPGQPLVKTLEVGDRYAEVTPQTAKFTGRIISDGGVPLTRYGFKYGTDPEALDQEILADSFDPQNGNYSLVARNLQPNTVYYYRSFAQNDEHAHTGEIQSVKTALYGEYQWVNNGKNIVNNEKLMVYYEMDPFEVTVKDLKEGTERRTRLYFLDRNLGALQLYTDYREDVTPSMMETCVGYYYKWGNKKPDLVYRNATGGSNAQYLLGNAAAGQSIGWRNNDNSAPFDQPQWPEEENPCPEGFHVPTLFEWQAFARYAGENGSNNGDFRDVFNLLKLGKTGCRDKTSLPSKLHTRATISTIAYLWSSTAERYRPTETIGPVEVIDHPGQTKTFNTNKQSSAAAYNFGVSVGDYILPHIGNTNQIDPTGAYSTAVYYDPWMYYGISTRDTRTGMPVRCVRTEYLD